MKTKIAKWVIDNLPEGIAVAGDLDYRGADRKEDCELIDSFGWLRRHYPELALLAFHPENEFRADKETYAQYYQSLKKGRVDGLCDFVMLSPVVGAPNLLIEFKRKNIGKSLSLGKSKPAIASIERFTKQMKILHAQSKTGAECWLCLSSDNFKYIIKTYCNKYLLDL